jgi:glucose/arabinose dehydrogenase
VRRVLVLVALLVSVALAGCTHDREATDPLTDDRGRPLGSSLRVLRVATGLEEPVFLTHAGDGSGRLFILEQEGRVRVVADGALASAPFLDIRDRVRSGGERGLLGLAFHPAFPDDGRVFVSYTGKDGGSVLSVFQVADGRADEASEEVLLEVEQPYPNHNGGMLAFGPDDRLYWALGDGGSGGDPDGNGQDPTTLLGGLLRLDVDAADLVADGNPFVGKEGADLVWAYGLRNPWRFSFDRGPGDLWIADVGQEKREEVNHVPAGEGAGWNFGWNAYEGSEPYVGADVADAVFPVVEYARRSPHCSVTGGYVYRGEDVPQLGGVYVFGDYCSGYIWGIERHRGEWVKGLLFESPHRISSFGEDEAGELYIVDHRGSVHRLASN